MIPKPINAFKCTNVRILRVSTNDVAICRDVYYKGSIHRSVTSFETMYRTKTSNFKNNTWFKTHFRE